MDFDVEEWSRVLNWSFLLGCAVFIDVFEPYLSYECLESLGRWKSQL